MMLSFAVIYVVSIVAICVAFSASDRQLDKFTNNGENESSHYFPRSRVKRAGKVIAFSIFRAMQARKAVDKILKSARLVRSDRLFSSQYEKPGGYKQAQNDFRSLDPDDVKIYDYQGVIQERVGTAGKFTIKIGNSGEQGKPYMKIFHDLDKPTARIDKIEYLN